MVRQHNSSPSSGEPASGRRPLSRELVVATAAALVDREGIDRLSLTRVAEELGVSQPALYKHVRDAADLLRLLALTARLELLDRLRDATVGRSGYDAVSAAAVAWRTFVHEHPGRYAATDRHPLAGFADLERAVDNIVALLARLASSYGLEPPEVDHAAWSLRASLHGFSSLESEQGHPANLDLDESFRHLVVFLDAGLRAMAEYESVSDRGGRPSA